MPPAARPSTPAPVRAAGLVLTLVATAAGAAGAATLAPEPAPASTTTRRAASVASSPSSADHLLSREHNARAVAARQRQALDETAAVNAARAAAAAQEAEEYARRVAMWDELAACETGGNWYDGGEFGGGLGIYVGTWIAYGGRDYAARPQWASKAEQIEIAERIANDGFGGWGCAHQLGWVN